MRILLVVVGLLGLAGCERDRSAGPGPASGAPADLVLLNGNVWTGNGAAPRAEAIAILGDTIAFVGSSAEAKAYLGPGVRIVDLQGASVFPGWIDAHVDLPGMEGVEGSSPSLTEAEQDSAVVHGARQAAERGWTQVHQVDATWADLARIRRLCEAGLIKLRMYVVLRGPGQDADSLLASDPVDRACDGRVTARAISVTLDGSLDSRDAALLAPYADHTADAGRILADTAAVADLLQRALERKAQVVVQATGDQANRLAFDLIQRAQRQYPKGEHDRYFRWRWRLDASTMVDSADAFRFRVLDLFPTVYPAQGARELALARHRVGATRARGLQRWRTFAELGIPVAAGSNASSGPGMVADEFYAAITQRSPTDAAADTLERSAEALTRELAVQMFTRFGAWAGFHDDKLGAIQVGRWADLTIFDRDLMAIPEEDIRRASVVMTIVAGQIVHESPRYGSARPR